MHNALSFVKKKYSMLPLKNTHCSPTLEGDNEIITSPEKKEFCLIINVFGINMQLLLCSALPDNPLKQQITTENRLDCIQRFVSETENLPNCVPYNSHLPVERLICSNINQF